MVVCAVLIWYSTRTSTSEESIFWGQLKPLPASDFRAAVVGMRLWYQRAGIDSPKSLVVLCEDDEIESVESVRDLLTDPSSIESIYLVKRTATNSAVLVGCEKDDIPKGIAVSVMLLDKLKFEMDKSARPEIGGNIPAYVNVKGVGSFEVRYVNDWGYYATTGIVGPRAGVATYDAIARSNYFEVVKKREFKK